MNRPAQSASGAGLLAPFEETVWYLILVSLICVGPLIYLLLWIRYKLTKDKEQKVYTLPHCVWFVYGALMKQGSVLSPTAGEFRIQYILILIIDNFN
jgi:4-amino-4-deoxy-L-arabinose transferase-like glycosyltransferase